MPRQKTLALILISFTILVTVITAFRIRDLPKSDIEKTSAFRKKCENCDSELNLGPKLPSIKSVSAKRSYEDLKAAVREKQQQIKQKSSNFKFEFSNEDDDDDDDDDDEILIKKSSPTKSLKEKSLQTKSHSSDTKKNKVVTDKKNDQKDDDEDDEDDDEDDDDEDLSKDTIIVRKNILNKSSPKSSPILPTKENTKPSALPKRKNDNDEDIKKKTNIEDKISESKKQKSLPTDKIKPNNNQADDLNSDVDKDNDTDDDDDDEEDDEDLLLTSSKNRLLKASPKPDSKLINKSKQDDGDDEDDDDVPNIKIQPKTADKSETKFAELIKKHDNPIKKPDQKHTEKTESTNSKDEFMNIIKKDTKTEDKQTKTENKHETKIDSSIKSKQRDEKVPIPINEKKIEHKEPEKQIKKEPKKEPPKPKEPEQKKPRVEQIDKKSVKKSDEKKVNEVKDHKRSEQKAQKEKQTKPTSETVHIEDIIAKQETYLKQVTEALHRRNLIQSEFEDFYAFFPTFAPNFSRIHNPECRRHGQILLRQLRGTKLWALNMLDATAKIPSGILQGNGIQLGDFDQCLGSHARVQLETGSIVRVKGKYCLARIELKAEDPELEVPVHLAQAKNLFRSRIDDPGHFVPRFSTLSWGVCVPAACNPEDVEVVLKDTVKHYQHTSGVLIRVKVEEQDCQVDDDDEWWEKWLEIPTVLTMSLYASICLLVLIATFKDYLARKPTSDEPVQQADEVEKEIDEKEKNEGTEEEVPAEENKSEGFLEAFSLYRTIDKLVAPGTTDDISCIHGVRGIATLALLVAHKFLPLAVTPYTNRVKITETFSSPLWSWCRAGWVYTDCFLLLSGALTAYRLTADSNSNAFKRLFTRYLRLTPALLAIVLFYAYVWDNISTGPMWGTLVSKNAEVCQEGWWWSLLYVQNYFGFEDMCAPQTHQLALDMQLSILGGIVVWALHAKPTVSKILLVNIHALTAYSRYTTTKEHRLTMIAYHGVSVTQLYRTARLSYTSTFHRSTPYLIGISLGLLLQNPSSHGMIVLTLGWVTSITLIGLVWWAGMDAGSPQYHYNTAFAAQYAALAPIASALAIAWLIYVVHSGHCDFLSRFLCWQPLVLVSRLSYALYLCQFIVFLTNAAVVRSSTEFSVLGLIDIQEIFNILLVSILMTLTFITPMQSLNKLFTFSSKANTEEVLEQTEGTENESPKKNVHEEKPTEEDEKIIEILPRRHFIAHREVLEEIPEAEIEYESQRDKIEGLEEIIEEEEDEEATDRDIDNQLEDDEDLQLEEDMEIIEEENEEGGEDFWTEDDERPRRSFRFDDDEADPEEWELTATSNGGGGTQHYRFRR